MTLGAALERALSRRFGAGVLSAERLSGGDINDAFAVTLGGGRRLFVKTNDRAPPGMFDAEARGLGFLAEARAIRLPDVLGVGAPDDPPYLALELVRAGPRRPGFDEELGRSLAALHRFGAPHFGLDHDNFIGSLAQSNRPCARWVEFFQSERLEPQLSLAARSGRADAAMRRGFERLFARLSELEGPEEPPARLHGDLWAGNLHVDESGAPCLIDPAAYAGHREMDLAMMRLFGGYSERVFDAYEESYPLAAGAEERVGLHQLYPLMVHVNLFGGGYARSVQAILDRYV
jgi:fructosamine-3-kinase